MINLYNDRSNQDDLLDMKKFARVIAYVECKY